MIEEKPVREQLEKIAKEFENAGTTKWTAIKIIKKLENEKLNSRKLKEQAFELLKELDPKAAEVYDSFQKMSVYNSQDTVRAFDRGNIIQSLLKETSLSRTMTEKIGAEVENKIKDLNIKYLNTSLIREMVSVKLLEFGQEEAHKEYTRIGMPVFDVEKNLQNEQVFRNEILKEYNWLKIIPQKTRELHFKSLIHIVHAHEFSTKHFSKNHYFKPTENTFEKQVIEFGEKIASLKKEVSGGITIDSINTSFATQIEKHTQNKINRDAELLLTQLKKSFKENKKENAVVCLDMFDSGKNQLSTGQKEKATEFAQAIIKHYNSNKQQFNFSIAIKIDSKYKLKLLENNQKNGFYYINCPEKNMTLHPQLIPAENNTQISILTALNLPKITAESIDLNGFEQKISEIFSELNKLFKLKTSLLQKTEHNENTIENQNILAIALYGLEQLPPVTGTEKNTQNILEKTITAFEKNCQKDTTLTVSTDKTTREKFVKANKELETTKNETQIMEKLLPEHAIKKVFIAKNEEELENLLTKKVHAVYLE